MGKLALWRSDPELIKGLQHIRKLGITFIFSIHSAYAVMFHLFHDPPYLTPPHIVTPEPKLTPRSITRMYCEAMTGMYHFCFKVTSVWSWMLTIEMFTYPLNRRRHD